MANDVSVAAWIRAGRPGAYSTWKQQGGGWFDPGGITPWAERLLPEWQKRLAPSRVVGAEEKGISISERQRRARREAQLAQKATIPEGITPSGGQQVPATRRFVPDPDTGMMIHRTFDREGNPIYALDEIISPSQMPGYTPSMSAAQKAAQKLAEEKFGWEKGQAAPPTELTPWERAQQQRWQRERTWEAEQAQMQRLQEQQRWTMEQTRWEQEQMAQQAWQQQQMQLEQQRLAQEEAAREAAIQAEREREIARLSANPLTWLQYAAYTEQAPVIQPWMMPLMPEQYGATEGGVATPSLPEGGRWEAGGIERPRLGASPWAIGQEIPGWTPESMAGMPALRTPSAQLFARMGPTAQAQFAGYRQARTGAMPEESQFRMWAMAPPGGRYGGLRRTR